MSKFRVRIILNEKIHTLYHDIFPYSGCYVNLVSCILYCMRYQNLCLNLIQQSVYAHTEKMGTLRVRPWKFHFLCTNFYLNYSPHQYTIFYRKHPSLLNLNSPLQLCSQNTTHFTIWAPLSQVKTTNIYTKFCKKATKRQAQYMHAMLMWQGLPPPKILNNFLLLTLLNHTQKLINMSSDSSLWDICSLF